MVFNIDVASSDAEALRLAVLLAFAASGVGKPSTNWKGISRYEVRAAFEVEEDEPAGTFFGGKAPKPARLIFFGGDRDGNGERTKLPFMMDADGVADFAARWLAEVEYPRPPRTDGSTVKGWRIDNKRSYGDEWDALITVSPHWIIYGK